MASDAGVFIAKRGILTGISKSDLRKAGVIVIEVDNHEDVKFIRCETAVSGGDMLMAALKALSSEDGSNSAGSQTFAGKQRDLFVKTLTEMLWSAQNP